MKYILYLLIILVILKIYAYIWLYVTSNRTKKSIELKIKSMKIEIYHKLRGRERFTITKSQSVENGTKVNHYLLSNNSDISWQFNRQIPSLDALYYKEGIENFIDCDVYEDRIVCDGTEISSLKDLHKALGLGNDYAICPKDIVYPDNPPKSTNRIIKYSDTIIQSLSLLHWPTQISFQNEALWPDNTDYANEQRIGWIKLQSFLENVIIIRTSSFPFCLLPVKFYLYYSQWYKTKLLFNTESHQQNYLDHNS